MPSRLAACSNIGHMMLIETRFWGIHDESWAPVGHNWPGAEFPVCRVLGWKSCVFRLRLLPAALAVAAVVAPCFVAAPSKTHGTIRDFVRGLVSAWGSCGVVLGDAWGSCSWDVRFSDRPYCFVTGNRVHGGLLMVLVTFGLSLIRITRAVSLETSEACQ